MAKTAQVRPDRARRTPAMLLPAFGVQHGAVGSGTLSTSGRCRPRRKFDLLAITGEIVLARLDLDRRIARRYLLDAAVKDGSSARIASAGVPLIAARNDAALRVVRVSRSSPQRTVKR